MKPSQTLEPSKRPPFLARACARYAEMLGIQMLVAHRLIAPVTCEWSVLLRVSPPTLLRRSHIGATLLGAARRFSGQTVASAGSKEE
jgi:hypothetical protein